MCKVSWGKMSCCHSSWEHSHGIIAYCTLLEMLDVFSLHLVVGQFFISSSVIHSPTYSQPAVPHTIPYLPAPPAGIILWSVGCSYNHVWSMLCHEVFILHTNCIVCVIYLVIFLLLLQIINCSMFNLCHDSYSVTWFHYLYLLSYNRSWDEYLPIIYINFAHVTPGQIVCSAL
jgi:hypothetical protein